jgi:hypothetical protein
MNYSFYGCRLQSAVPLSFVRESAWNDSSPVITLTQGEVPDTLPDPVWSSPFVSISAAGAVLIQVDAVGRFLVESGLSITIQLKPGATPVETEAFLMGPVAGVLLHQRGVLPLHASCVEIDGVAIALAGPVGRGKSTLAAALVRNGAALMGDDICPVGLCADVAPIAIPGSAGLRLWPDAREIFGCGGAEWSPIRPGHSKHVGPVNVGGQWTDAPLPRRLGMVIRLAPGSPGEPDLTRLRGPTAVSPMSDLVYRVHLGRALGRGEDLFRGTMRLADEVPVFELRRPHGFEHLEKTAELVLSAVEGSV